LTETDRWKRTNKLRK